MFRSRIVAAGEQRKGEYGRRFASVCVWEEKKTTAGGGNQRTVRASLI